MNYIFLNLIFLNCKEQLAIQRMSLSKARANEADSTPNTNNTFWFRSSATWTQKARCAKKILENDKAQSKDPELTTLFSEVGGGTNVQSKQAHVPQCKS